MENWENKIIGDKLNSLEDLPDGYLPNIASKWEIIQSGLQGRKKRSKRGWYLCMILLAVLAIGWFVFTTHQPQNEPKPKTSTLQPFDPVTKTEQVKPETSEPDGKQEQKQTAKKQLLKKNKPVIIPKTIEPVQTTKPLFDSFVRIRVDTTKITIPIAKVNFNKPRKRTYQKDFEGFVSSTDSTQEKTVKGFQIKWRSGRDKEAALDQPRIRLTPNF